MLLIVGQPAGLMSSPIGKEEAVGLGVAVRAAFGRLMDMEAGIDTGACPRLIDQLILKNIPGQSDCLQSVKTSSGLIDCQQR